MFILLTHKEQSEQEQEELEEYPLHPSDVRYRQQTNVYKAVVTG